MSPSMNSDQLLATLADCVAWLPEKRAELEAQIAKLEKSKKAATTVKPTPAASYTDFVFGDQASLPADDAPAIQAKPTTEPLSATPVPQAAPIEAAVLPVVEDAPPIADDGETPGGIASAPESVDAPLAQSDDETEVKAPEAPTTPPPSRPLTYAEEEDVG